MGLIPAAGRGYRPLAVLASFEYKIMLLVLALRVQAILSIRSKQVSGCMTVRSEGEYANETPSYGVIVSKEAVNLDEVKLPCHHCQLLRTGCLVSALDSGLPLISAS
jgi:hypothetical protein